MQKKVKDIDYKDIGKQAVSDNDASSNQEASVGERLALMCLISDSEADTIYKKLKVESESQVAMNM